MYCIVPTKLVAQSETCNVLELCLTVADINRIIIAFPSFSLCLGLDPALALCGVMQTRGGSTLASFQNTDHTAWQRAVSYLFIYSSSLFFSCLVPSYCLSWCLTLHLLFFFLPPRVTDSLSPYQWNICHTKWFQSRISNLLLRPFVRVFSIRQPWTRYQWEYKLNKNYYIETLEVWCNLFFVLSVNWGSMFIFLNKISD